MEQGYHIRNSFSYGPPTTPVMLLVV